MSNLKDLMNNKPFNFVSSVMDTLNAKRDLVLDNKQYIFSQEVNQRLGVNSPNKINEEQNGDANYLNDKGETAGQKKMIADHKFVDATTEIDGDGKPFVKEDVEQLDEISAEKLGKYIHGSIESIRDNDINPPKDLKKWKRGENRVYYHDLAVNKLVKKVANK